MRKKLHAIYIKSDTSCKELAKTALAQLILKVIFSHEMPISSDKIKSEVNDILDAKLHSNKITEAIDLLFAEDKIKRLKDEYGLTSSRRKKMDLAYQEFIERHNRIIEKYFSPTKSSKTAILNWFENVTITFFTEFRSEWIAEKAYNVRTVNAYDGLQNIVKKETNKDSNINSEDREWLISQYNAFFRSTDEDLNSIYWDYGTCAYSSSLITATNSANQITIDMIKKSKFVLDTNILMYLTLEGGKYYESYNALGEIFKELEIQPGYFYITRDEYIRGTANKKEQIINVSNKYDEEVIEQIEDDFIKTAKVRQCVCEEDIIRFFDELLDPPTEFIKDLKIVIFDDEYIKSAVDIGTEDEELKEQLNTIFINRHKHSSKILDKLPISVEKGKSPRSLMHDAGLIRGAEYLRTKEKCFILTREISVKQYGILKAIRNEPFISIGLDTLISMLAIGSGGIDIDPANFKPLFAKIIKLALLPEKGVFQAEDLVRMLDIEENIAELPNEDVISIAKEMHRFQMSDIDDKKITVEITRKFQNAKMHLKRDLGSAEAQVLAERNQKDIYKKVSDKAESALKKRIHKEVTKDINFKRGASIFFYLFVFPLITTITTIFIIYQHNSNLTDSWFGHLIGFLINIIAWFCIDFFFMLPKLTKSHKTRLQNIDDEVQLRIMESIDNTNT
jgi:hypothetical protein